MGNFCWMCERMRPNEAFSGRNHGRHLCRDCASLPKSERDRKDQLSALWHMLRRQSNISQRNIQAATAWAAGADADVAALAQLVAEIARAHPGKRKRLPYIRRNHPGLWQRMIVAGLVDDRPDNRSSPELSEEFEWPRQGVRAAIILGRFDEEGEEDDGEIPF